MASCRVRALAAAWGPRGGGGEGGHGQDGGGGAQGQPAGWAVVGEGGGRTM
jgi:hypothetical protein